MDPTYKDNFIKAGAIANQVRQFGKSLIQTGASYQTVIRQINEKIKELGAQPAFPPQIALNQVAAHFLPQPDRDIIFKDEVIKLDVGICYQGAIGDCAVTVDLSGKHGRLIEAAEAALLAAEKILTVGLPIREIGKIIETTIASYGFNPIKNLSGHGLGYYQVHTAPSIPNYDDHSSGVIRPGMTFAIEPFATTGFGFIYETANPMIFSLLKEKSIREASAKKLLEKIRPFGKLPFALQDLMESNHSVQEIKQQLNRLVRADVLAAYGPLIEETGGLVAQAENSVLVDLDGQILITTRGSEIIS